MPRRWTNTPRPIPELLFVRHFFDLRHPVVRPVHFRPISPTIASRNFWTPANRSATPYYYIDISSPNNLFNSGESSYWTVCSSTLPKSQFQGGGEFRTFHQNRLSFFKIRHFIFLRHRILMFVSWRDKILIVVSSDPDARYVSEILERHKISFVCPFSCFVVLFNFHKIIN